MPMMRFIDSLPANAMNTTTTASVTAPPPAPTTYLSVLTWLFTLFNSVRVLAYLPTLWAIVASGDSSQHSLLTWVTWIGANATMAAWLYEHNGQQMDKAIGVSLANATACAFTAVVILWFR